MDEKQNIIGQRAHLQHLHNAGQMERSTQVEIQLYVVQNEHEYYIYVRTIMHEIHEVLMEHIFWIKRNQYVQLHKFLNHEHKQMEM